MSISLVDSNAHFKSKCTECGFSGALMRSFETGGIDTLAKLAFSVGQPGQAIDPAEVDTLLGTLTGAPPSIGEAAMVKRLVFESHTIMIATLKQSVEQKDDGVPKRVPAAERTTRMNLLKRTVPGIEISGEYEPSHSLLDKASDVYDKNVVKYIDPAQCTSRSAEVQGITKTRELALENGALVARDKDNKLQAPTSSEMQLFYALSRRGLAYQFAELLTFTCHQRWVSFLFSALHREVPPGYSKPNLHQIMQCDRAAWVKIAETCEDVRRRADGTYPLENYLDEVKKDPTVTLYLSPLAKPAPATLPIPGLKRNYDAMSDGAIPGPKGGGKGKKGGKGKSPAMPKELIGKYHRTAQGEPLCFAFNTQAGCPEKDIQPGQRCSKGYHLCAEPRCQQNHSLVNHRKSSA